MRVKAFTAGLLMPALFLAAFFISTASGYWRTESSKIPAKYSVGESAGEYNPADIRGSYYFRDIEKVFGVSSGTLAAAYGFTDRENPGDIQVKMLEGAYGMVEGREVGTDSIRLFVALYKGLPYTPEEDTALPEPAWHILRDKGESPSAVLELYVERVVPLGEKVVEVVPPSPVDEERLVKGNTTFDDLLSWGIPPAKIEEALGSTMGATGQSLRVFCTDNGLEFSLIKAVLQDLTDELP